MKSAEDFAAGVLADYGTHDSVKTMIRQIQRCRPDVVDGWNDILVVAEYARRRLAEVQIPRPDSLAARCLCFDPGKGPADSQGEGVDSNDIARLQRAYLAEGGNLCPFCGSPNLSADGEVEVAGAGGKQAVRCMECRAMWLDVYALIGFETIKWDPTTCGCKGGWDIFNAGDPGLPLGEVQSCDECGLIGDDCSAAEAAREAGYEIEEVEKPNKRRVYVVRAVPPQAPR